MSLVNKNTRAQLNKNHLCSSQDRGLNGKTSALVIEQSNCIDGKESQVRRAIQVTNDNIQSPEIVALNQRLLQPPTPRSRPEIRCYRRGVEIPLKESTALRRLRYGDKGENPRCHAQLGRISAHEKFPSFLLPTIETNAPKTTHLDNASQIDLEVVKGTGWSKTESLDTATRCIDTLTREDNDKWVTHTSEPTHLPLHHLMMPLLSVMVVYSPPSSFEGVRDLLTTAVSLFIHSTDTPFMFVHFWMWMKTISNAIPNFWAHVVSRVSHPILETNYRTLCNNALYRAILLYSGVPLRVVRDVATSGFFKPPTLGKDDKEFLVSIYRSQPHYRFIAALYFKRPTDFIIFNMSYLYGTATNNKNVSRFISLMRGIADAPTLMNSYNQCLIGWVKKLPSSCQDKEAIQNMLDRLVSVSATKRVVKRFYSGTGVDDGLCGYRAIATALFGNPNFGPLVYNIVCIHQFMVRGFDLAHITHAAQHVHGCSVDVLRLISEVFNVRITLVFDGEDENVDIGVYTDCLTLKASGHHVEILSSSLTPLILRGDFVRRYTDNPYHLLSTLASKTLLQGASLPLPLTFMLTEESYSHESAVGLNATDLLAMIYECRDMPILDPDTEARAKTLFDYVSINDNGLYTSKYPSVCLYSDLDVTTRDTLTQTHVQSPTSDLNVAATRVRVMKLAKAFESSGLSVQAALSTSTLYSFPSTVADTVCVVIDALETYSFKDSASRMSNTYSSNGFVTSLSIELDQVRKLVSYKPVEDTILAAALSDLPDEIKPKVDWMLQYGDIRSALTATSGILSGVIERLRGCFKKVKREAADYAANEILNSFVETLKDKFASYGPLVLKLIRIATGLYCIVKLASTHTERILLSLVTFAPEIREYLPKLIEALTTLQPQNSGPSTSLLDIVVRLVSSVLGVPNVSGVASLTMEQVRNFSVILATAKSLSSTIVTVLSLAYDICSAFYERWLLTSQPTNQPVHTALDSIYAAIIACPSPIVDYASACAFKHDRDVLLRFHALHARFGTYRNTTQTIDKLLANSTHLLEEATARINALPKVAPPLAIYVSGGAGIGKTTMLNALYKTFYAAQKDKIADGVSYSKHQYRNDECAASDVWTPPKGESYLGDAYRSTPITRFDDHVVTQNRNESNAFFAELFNLISKDNNPMLCANPANKGKVFYDGDLVTVTSNAQLRLGNATLVCMPALRRRFDVIAEARRDRNGLLLFDILDYLGQDGDDYVIRATLTENEFLKYIITIDKHRASLIRTDTLRIGQARGHYEARDDDHFIDIYHRIHAAHLSHDFRNTSTIPAFGNQVVEERRVRCTEWVQAFNFTRDLTIDGTNPALRPPPEVPVRSGLADFFVNHVMLATHAITNTTIDSSLQVYNYLKNTENATLITIGASALMVGQALMVAYKYCKKNSEDEDLPDFEYDLDPQSSNNPAVRTDGKSKGANAQRKARRLIRSRINAQRSAANFKNNAHKYVGHNDFDVSEDEADATSVIDEQILLAMLRAETILTAHRKEYSKDLYGLRYTAGKYVFPLHYDKAVTYGDRFELTYPDKDGRYHTIDITGKFTAHRSLDRHLLCVQLNRSDIHGGGITSAISNDLEHFNELNLRDNVYRLIHPELDVEPVGVPRRETHCGPGLSFRAHGQDGDCGMPYFTRVKNPDGVFLLGFHTHGSNVESFMTILTNKDIIATFAQPNFMQLRDVMPAFRPYLHEQNRMVMEGISTFFPAPTSHREAMTFGMLQEPIKKPMSLSDPEFSRNAVPTETNVSCLNMTSLRRAIELFIIRHPYPTCMPLTVLEAFGVSSPIGAMNMDSSAGYNANSFKKKSDLFVTCSTDTVQIKPEALIEYNTYEEELYQPINKSSLKDETRNEQKRVTKSARLFFVSPYYHVVFGRRYMGELAERFQNNCVSSVIAIGINPLSRDWDALYHRFTRFGEHGRYLAGDKKRYDTTIPYSIMWAALRVIRYYYPSVPDEVYDHLLSTICVGTHTFLGFQMVKLNGNSSGGPYTSFINSVCNALMTLYCLVESSPETVPDTIWDHVDLHVYGDDDIMSLDVRHIPWFNMLTLQKELATIGVTYTSAHKDRKITAFMPLKDIVFLQRSFSVEEDGVFSPRPLTAVMDQMQYYKNGAKSDPTDADITRSCAVSVLYELSQHPQDVFNKNASLLNAALRRVGVAPLLQTHTELRCALYFDSDAVTEKECHEVTYIPSFIGVESDDEQQASTELAHPPSSSSSPATDFDCSAVSNPTVDNAVGHSTLNTNPNNTTNNYQLDDSQQNEPPLTPNQPHIHHQPETQLSPINPSSYRVTKAHSQRHHNDSIDKSVLSDCLSALLFFFKSRWRPQAPRKYDLADLKRTKQKRTQNRAKTTITNRRNAEDRKRTQAIRALRSESIEWEEQSDFNPSVGPNLDEIVAGDATQVALVTAFAPEHNALLSREFKVATAKITSGSVGVLKAIDILPALEGNPYIKNILDQYRTYTFDVSLIARVSGTMAYDALVALVYVPRVSYNLLSDSQNVNRSTFPYYQHTLFNITEKKDHTLTVTPYTNEQGFSFRSIHQAGHFNVVVVHPLMGPSSNAESVSLSLFLRVDNVSLLGRQLKPQSDEASTKSMGRNFAELVQGIPKVVDPAKRIIKGVADFITNPFGFQQPTDVKAPEQVIVVPSTNPLNVRGLTSGYTMTLDPATQASTSLANAIVCSDPINTLLDVAQRLGVLANFSITSQSGTIVYQTPISPRYFYSTIAGQKYSTPFRIAASQAVMYSGSCVFMLQVTASPFSRCSLQFTWTPDPIPAGIDPSTYPDQVVSRVIDFSGSGVYSFVTPNYSPAGRALVKSGDLGHLTISIVNHPYVSDDALLSSFECTLYVAAGQDTQFFHRALQPQNDLKSFLPVDPQYLSTTGCGLLTSNWEGERLEHLKDILLTNVLHSPTSTDYTLTRNHSLARCFNIQRIGYNVQVMVSQPTSISIISGYPPTSSSYRYPTPFLVDCVSTSTLKIVVPYVHQYEYLIKSPWSSIATANVSVSTAGGVESKVLLSYSDDTLFADFTYPGISAETLIDDAFL